HLVGDFIVKPLKVNAELFGETYIAGFLFVSFALQFVFILNCRLLSAFSYISRCALFYFFVEVQKQGDAEINGKSVCQVEQPRAVAVLVKDGGAATEAKQRSGIN